MGALPLNLDRAASHLPLVRTFGIYWRWLLVISLQNLRFVVVLYVMITAEITGKIKWQKPAGVNVSTDTCGYLSRPGWQAREGWGEDTAGLASHYWQNTPLWRVLNSRCCMSVMFKEKPVEPVTAVFVFFLYFFKNKRKWNETLKYNEKTCFLSPQKE